jgi:Kdo2-lipid IVA lauroyltransferase/acyltransferase
VHRRRIIIKAKRALHAALRWWKHALRPALRPLMWPLQSVALALFWARCAAMPPERAAAFGARHRRALGPRLHRHRRLRDNLAIALPHATADQVETYARAVWSSFGATLAEYAHFGLIAERAFDQHVEVVLHPGIAARRNGGGGPFVFVTAHLGNREISAATARHLGPPLTVVYSRQANPVTEWLVQRQRRYLRCRFLTSDDGMRRLLQELHAGRSIGMLVDVRVENGEAVPFCGQDTTTTLLPARLALRFGCPLIPVRVERLRPAHLRVTLYDPVLPDDGAALEFQARCMMARINALFESWIVARPHEWQCFQNRWPESTRRTALELKAPGRADPRRSSAIRTDRRRAAGAASGGVHPTGSTAWWRT